MDRATAAALLERGHISQETYDLVTGARSPMAPAPGMPPTIHAPVVLPEPSRTSGQQPDPPAMLPTPGGMLGPLAPVAYNALAPGRAAALARQADVEAFDAAVPVGPPMVSQHEAAVRGGRFPGLGAAPSPSAPAVSEGAAGSGTAALPEQTIVGHPAAPAGSAPASQGAASQAGSAPAPGPTDPRQLAMLHEVARIEGDRGLAGRQGDLDRSRAGEEADAAKARADALEHARIAHMAEQREDDERAQAQVARLEQARAEYAATTVDPKRMWKDMGAGNQAAAALFVGLGGFLEGYSGGAVKNRALDILERAVDRSIAAQESAMAKAGRAVDIERSVLSDMMRINGNRESARAMAKITMLEGLKAEADARAARYGTEQAAINAEALKKGLDDKIGVLRDQWQVTAWTEQRQAAAAARSAAQAAERQAFERGVKLTELDQKQQQLDTERTKADAEAGKRGEENSYTWRGTLYRAPDAAAAAEIRKTVAAEEQLSGTTREILMLRGDGGALDPAKRARLEQLGNDLITAAGVASNVGIVNPSEVDRLRAVAGDPAALTDFFGRERARVEGMLRTAQTRSAAVVGTYGGAAGRAAVHGTVSTSRPPGD